MKKIIVDLDDTLTHADKDSKYEDVLPNLQVINKLREYKDLGFEIVIYTSRNMNTFEGNVGRINVVTLPIILKWLEKYNVPFDEIYVGKPWCGFEGFYIDDKAIRPSEFLNLSYEAIKKLTKIV